MKDKTAAKKTRETEAAERFYLTLNEEEKLAEATVASLANEIANTGDLITSSKVSCSEAVENVYYAFMRKPVSLKVIRTARNVHSARMAVVAVAGLPEGADYSVYWWRNVCLSYVVELAADTPATAAMAPAVVMHVATEVARLIGEGQAVTLDAVTARTCLILAKEQVETVHALLMGRDQ